jgi:hypothetical protein
MSIHCDVILRWTATPEQLHALGAALWRWGNRQAGNTGVYPYLDNQELADLLEGKFPWIRLTAGDAERRRVRLWVRGKPFPDRQSAIDSLRGAIPADCVEDVLVEGASWNGKLLASIGQPC